MNALVVLAQSLGLAYASGVSLYATTALVGLLARGGYVGPLPGSLSVLTAWPLIAISLVMFAFEFLATLVPGVASVWETVHTAIRPPAAAALAVLTAWHGDPMLIGACALLGGGLALTTHATKLGLRYAIDASPEPVTNGMANVAELGMVATVSYFVWHHPFTTLVLSLAVLVLVAVTVRIVWRTLGRFFRGELRRPPARQAAAEAVAR